MFSPTLHIQTGQHLLLSPSRSIFWEEARTLILSDLHLGKTGHFRKSGIAVPQQVYREDLQRLVALLQWHQPERLIVVGDMFHSFENRELDWFVKWRHDFSGLEIELVKGNHDILENDWYTRQGIRLHTPYLDLGPFRFIHDQNDQDETDDQRYTLSGHLHPGISLKGGGKQNLRFPCFYFGKKQAILPAFSAFTGTAALTPERGDKVYAIVEQTLVAIT